jgi:hypothetical protein
VAHVSLDLYHETARGAEAIMRLTEWEHSALDWERLG